MPKKKLLVVDDHPKVRRATRWAFEQDFEILEASDEEEALRIYDSEAPEVVFLDLEFNGIVKGWDILGKIRTRGNQAVVLIVTGLAAQSRNPMASEADGFFVKPCDLNTLRKCLNAKGVLP